MIHDIFSISAIELVAGLGYLIGHILLSKKHILGWIAKILGGIAWVTFLMQNENYIFMAVTTVVVLTMVYGLYKWNTGTYDTRTKVDLFFEVLVAAVAVVMITRFLLSGVYDIAPIFEVFIVLAEVLGTILLARKLILGWYLYILMSVLVGILVIFINQHPALLLGILELSSLYFYYKGIRNFQND
ncbi:MAG: nicotinamide mononucleotide transporter [Candidatus Woesearchaeota archaeon]|nr:nicotinamide mononucleotide transporter [Candidatus Woesearchaeota archaeon]